LLSGAAGVGSLAASGLARAAADTGTVAGPETVTSTIPRVRGTWVLHGSDSAADVRSWEKRFLEILARPGVTGLSIRAPWNALEPTPNTFDLSIFEEAGRIADAAGVPLAMRFVAGSETPTWRMGRGEQVTGTGMDGEPWTAVIPIPFLDDGSPNVTFEQGWGRLVDVMALWAGANRVPFLHGGWWGDRWAELFLDGLTGLEGYSYPAVRDAHLRLVDRLLALSGPARRCELPVSGSVGDATIGQDITAHVAASPAWNWFYIQSTHIDEGTLLGGYAPPPRRGWQMLDAIGYDDWEKIYAECMGAGEYLEVYAESFFAGNVDELYRQASLVH